MRRLRLRDVGIIAAMVLLGALIGAVAWTTVDAARAREQATRQLEAQAVLARDTRAAQTRRIDLLTEQVRELSERSERQEALIAAQSQAIADLSEQLRRAGADPITTDPAPTPSSAPGPTAAPRTSAAQEPPSPPAPAPADTDGRTSSPPPVDDEPDGPVDPAPLCLPLDLLCIG